MASLNVNGVNCQEQILNSLSREITASVIYVDSAHAMWSDLNERFSQGNGPHIYQLQKSIASLTQDDLAVGAYFTKMKGVWDELLNYSLLSGCSCSVLRSLMDMQQQEYVMRFLMGLNDSFSHIRGQILLNEPLPSINKGYSLIIQEERQREIGSVMLPAIPLAATIVVVKLVHQNKSNTRRPICSHCSIPGHTLEKCFKLHGYPPGYRSKSRSSNSSNSSNFSTNHSAYVNNVAAESSTSPSLPLTPEQCQ
ncbi:uncharacterized protein [Aristolochia californica]|uniref:uncharacterized protein n=1 Tax=Aristolochia californica TaxID=171875 RepID=UPI0035DB2CE4